MLSDYKLTIPQLPGFDMAKWVTAQANLIQNLAKNARRNHKNIKNKSGGSMGDAVTTLPYSAEDWFYSKMPTD